MELKEAREYLKPPLIFGNARQIDARKFLERVAEAKERIEACRQQHAVYKCADRWKLAQCTCVIEYDDDVRLAAADQFIEEAKR